MLLGEIMKWFQSNNIDRVELQNTAKNPLANSFWQKQGFEIYQYTRFKKIK
jgi:ribosomal protein S18 acetylase RimI-like enzyme